MQAVQASSIYTGMIRHQRFTPAKNFFSYWLALFYLDLSEIENLFQKRAILSWFLSFERKNYLGPITVPLDQAVRDRCEKELGFRPQGPIRILTQLSYFGFCFNPVSFYYCFDEQGLELVAILSEITNTPWKERHVYALKPSTQGEVQEFAFDKTFHVSPFMPMDMHYRWFFGKPGQKLFIHMENYRNGEEPKVFDATLSLVRKNFSHREVWIAFLKFPLLTFKTVILIHWQALILFLKKVPVFTHPKSGVQS